MISVIIPVFNRVLTLKRAVASVLNQTYKDFEVIVVDDGSSDGSIESIKGMPVKIISQDNHGVSFARNRGINASQGDYIAFLDSDDEWLPKKLEEQIKFEAACCHTEEIWIRNGVRVNQMKKHKKGRGDQFIPSLDLCLISPSSAMIRRDVFNQIGFFREDYPVCEDYDLWLKLTSLYEVKFIDTPMIKKYGGHEDQLSRKFKAMDHWRVKSIVWILDNRELSPPMKNAAVTVLEKKLSILIKGYEKYQRVEELQEMRKLYQTYIS